MKIVFAIKTLEHSVGGAERITSCLANALHDRGHDITVLSFDTHGSQGFYPLNPGISRAYVPATDTSCKTSIKEIPKLLVGLRKTITDLNPDVVVAVMHSMFVPLQLALLGTGTKIIFSEHTVPKYYKDKRVEFAALTLTALLAHRVTIASETVKSLYPGILQPRMTVIPNPVFSSFKRADVVASNLRKTILSVGRLDPMKDHSVLIKAFAMIAETYSDWDLRIIGEGPERKNLEALITSYNLQSRVQLPGTMKNVDEAYESAQIFVMPSRYESFGLVTAEAITHTLPVIGFSDCTGTNELVDHEKNGILVKNRSPEDLRDALITLMSSADIRQKYSDESLIRSRRFDFVSIIKQWESLIIG